MMPQFTQRRIYRPHSTHIAIGVTLFSIGLFKKVVLADGLAKYATPVFEAAADGTSLTFFEAWGGALAYTLQLYFDFSGYTDMAIGSARFFGIQLPLNFNSPYKASNIIDFWRRWHMTLSRFLRDYLYFTLGGNRKGVVRRYVNIMLTMLLGGLWHGAGWTFVFWGVLHGLYLCVNHGWHVVVGSWDALRLKRMPGARLLGIALTFLSVVVAWVFFRAETFEAALIMLHAMTSVGDLQLPMQLSGRLGSLESLLLEWGFGLDGQYVIHPKVWIVGLPLIVFSMILLVMPNSNQIADHCMQLIRKHMTLFSLFLAIVAAIAVLSLGRVSEFLYFQF
jgi:D-alanyl-lipoteichoic acid acyltransferase DltB (MBOAT superfamily)